MQNRHPPFCKPSGVALRFSASPVMLTHITIVMSNPLVAAKRKRRWIHVLHSFSGGGWVYQILKSRNASFCSFLLLPMFACSLACLSRRSVSEDGSRRNAMKTDHAHRFALSNPLVAAKRKRRRIHVLRSFSEGGWVYQILALLRAISRGFFLCLFSGIKAVFPIIGEFC